MLVTSGSGLRTWTMYKISPEAQLTPGGIQPNQPYVRPSMQESLPHLFAVQHERVCGQRYTTRRTIRLFIIYSNSDSRMITSFLLFLK